MTSQLFVKMAINAWNMRIREAENAFQNLTDEQLEIEIAPGRNRGIYLLGHLTAVHDRMLAELNFQQRLVPELDDIFLNSPDKSITVIPSANELRTLWKNVNDVLSHHLKMLPADEWFQRHTLVSPEDFKKEPHRNRLNLLINRTIHLAHHLGQIALLKVN